MVYHTKQHHLHSICRLLRTLTHMFAYFDNFWSDSAHENLQAYVLDSGEFISVVKSAPKQRYRVVTQSALLPLKVPMGTL